MYTVHCIIVCCLPTIRILHEPETAFTLLNIFFNSLILNHMK